MLWTPFRRKDRSPSEKMVKGTSRTVRVDWALAGGAAMADAAARSNRAYRNRKRVTGRMDGISWSISR
jgi:hypothetical protein